MPSPAYLGRGCRSEIRAPLIRHSIQSRSAFAAGVGRFKGWRAQRRTTVRGNARKRRLPNFVPTDILGRMARSLRRGKYQAGGEVAISSPNSQRMWLGRCLPRGDTVAIKCESMGTERCSIFRFLVTLTAYLRSLRGVLDWQHLGTKRPF